MSREAEVLKVLLSLSKDISSSTPMQKVVKKMTHSLQKVLGADECSILILDETHRELAFSESSGLSKWEVGHIRFRLGEGVAGWVARHKKPVLIPDVNIDERFVQFQKQKRIQSMICVPLHTKRTMIGAVSLTTRDADHVFTENELEIAVLLAANISLALENNRLYEISVSDGLTNLYNRRYLDGRLNKELAYSKRFHKPLTVLMADLDFFKRLNDTYGHQTGDHALKCFSEILGASLREYDVVARYGGEEFVVLLPSTPRNQGGSIAERIRMSVAAKEYRYRQHSFQMTTSIGVAAYPENCDTPEGLILKADCALYQAKTQGRNQVVCFDEERTPLQKSKTQRTPDEAGS